MNYKKTILKTVLFTFLSLIALTIVLFCFMYFVFTSSFANLMYEVGSENFASHLYLKSYEKSDEIFYCYKAFNIKIKLGDNKAIVDFYERLTSDNEYEQFIVDCNTKNEKLSVGVLEKSTILNEENYLTGNYIKALIETDDNNKAWDLTLTELSKYKSFSLKEQGVYSLSLFINEDNYSKFNTAYEGFEGVLIDEMQEYFDITKTIFDNNKDTDNELNKAYLVSLGNRLITLGKDINEIYTALDIKADIKSINQANMMTINEEIKGLI